ncbi:MAG: VTT domain-containing protein [Methanobacteriota archaeon]|nr:MAG: VTT domain-containing protein [Euryarchaeota archaeon]TLZ74450.1 MAG: VTT domain-containing protein [Euryarchaeota archaeon]
MGVLRFASLQFGLDSAGALGYLAGLFVYSIAAAIILPIPVEALLPFYPEIHPAIKAIVLGLGKAVGAIAVFYVGNKVNPFIERWMGRHPWGAKILKAMETFVRRTGWIGLTVLLAIPFMSDTAVNYFYSLLNEEGHAIGRWRFVLSNLIGGVARAYLYILIWVRLFPG